MNVEVVHIIGESVPEYCRVKTVTSFARRLAAVLAVAVATTGVGVMPAYSAAEGPTVLKTSATQVPVAVTDAPVNVTAQSVLTPPPLTPPVGSSEPMTPTISGTAAVGQKLSLDTGVWPPDTKFIYRWHTDGVSLKDVTGPTFVLGPEHACTAISARVIGTWPGPPSVSTYADTDPTAKVAYATLTGSTPAVSGKTTVGQTLSIDPGTWT